MNARSICIVLAVVFSTHPVTAQNATVFRPDTTGANFDHLSPGTGTPNDFDFLEGVWSFHFQTRDQNNPAVWLPASPGIWTGRKTHEGLVLEDEFRRELPNGARSMTVTYRTFNAAKNLWEIQGVGGRRGGFQPGIGWRVGDTRFLVQQLPETKLIVRIKYYNVTPDHFNWRADGSLDGGKTWTNDIWLLEAKRVSASSN